MSFDPSLIPFLTVGNYSGGSYGIPLSQPLVTNSSYGLNFINSGPGNNFTLATVGNLAAVMTLQNSNNYGLMVSVPQVDGGIITRTIVDSSSIIITNRGGQLGNVSLSVVPSSTLQLISTKVGGVSTGGNRNTIDFIAGTGIGLSYVDTGTQTNITISSTGSSAAPSNAPYIIYTADSTLTAAQNIGLLTTGLVKNTVASSSATLSTAVSGTDYLAPSTNLNQLSSMSTVTGGIIEYSGGAFNMLAPSSTTGQVLTTLSSTSIGWTNAASLVDTWSNYPAISAINANTHLINNVVDPVSLQDAATKHYVDTHSGGAPVGAGYLITQANSTLTAPANLGALSTGLVLSTVSSSISTISTVPESTFAQVAAANAFTSTNTFNSFLPSSTVTPVNPTDLITKTYGDTTYGILTAANVWSGAANTFNANPIFPTGAATSYVPVSTSSSGAWTWQALPGFPSSATITTTNNTATTLIAVPVAAGASVTVQAWINGSSADHSDCTGGSVLISATRTSVGIITAVATPIGFVNATSTGTFAATADVGTESVLIQVTGLASTTYHWSATYIYQTT